MCDCVLHENRHASERSLNYLLAHHTRTCKELDDLTKAHGESDKSNKSSRKRIKKEIDLRHKELESLRERISYYELHLGQDPSENDTPNDDGLFGHSAQARMATAPGVNDTPSESAMTQTSDPPPTEGQTHAMEVDDKGIHSCPASPISTAEDNLLMGGGAVGVELDLAHLTVSSPRNPNGQGEEHPTRCLAAAAHFLIRKKLFNSKYPQLLVAKDFAVAEKKLHLTVSGRKYDPVKKAPKIRHTSDVKTADPKPSTSQDQPQDESVSEQQPQDESISEEQPQGASTTEQQPQGDASPDTQQEPVHHNSAMMMNFQIHTPLPEKLLPQKILDLYQRNQNIVYDQKHITFNPLYLCLIFLLQIKRKMSYTLEKLTYCN